MKYLYHDLYPLQFEKLVVALCQCLFGASAQGFAAGPDGGCDVKFIGTAENFPSKAAPWVGTTIIQAKHTNGTNRTFSEADFFSKTNKSCVINKEIVNIQNLKAKGKLDHYMLVSNRRQSGNIEEQIREHISNQCGIPEASIHLCDVNLIDMWLKKYPDIAKAVDLDPVNSPLIITPDDLANIVIELAKIVKAEKGSQPVMARVSLAQKNSLNNMTETYSEQLLKSHLPYERQIFNFLADPKNERTQNLYDGIIEELQLKIIAKRRDYQTFDAVMEYIFEHLTGRDPDLKTNKRLLRAVLFYMYWHCDIGKTHNVATN